MGSFTIIEPQRNSLVCVLPLTTHQLAICLQSSIISLLCSLIRRRLVPERGICPADAIGLGAQIHNVGSGHFQAQARQLTSPAGLRHVAWTELKGHTRRSTRDEEPLSRRLCSLNWVYSHARYHGFRTVFRP
jgi:hypothetical protein